MNRGYPFDITIRSKGQRSRSQGHKVQNIFQAIEWPAFTCSSPLLSMWATVYVIARSWNFYLRQGDVFILLAGLSVLFIKLLRTLWINVRHEIFEMGTG